MVNDSRLVDRPNGTGRRGQLEFTLQTNAFEYSLPFLESEHFGTWQTMKQTIKELDPTSKMYKIQLES